MKKLRPAYVRAFARARSRSAFRRSLIRYARSGKPRAESPGNEIVILLGTAWGMGGTIRTVLNVAGYLAREHDVEIISVSRSRDEPFFEWPPGVKFSVLQDKTPEYMKRMPWLERRLRDMPSVLMHPADKTYDRGWKVWTDIQLARRLRGRSGYLMGTRPGLNLIVADLDLPGFVTIGQEHMHFYHHVKPLRRAIKRDYAKLDSLVVLTERDRSTYGRKLNYPPPIVRIANSVRDMGAGRADLDAPVVLAAGRLSPQKGYDLLLQAWPAVAEQHPDWQLKIYGRGPQRKKLERLKAEHDLNGSVSLEPAATNLGAEMERAAIFVMSSRFEGFPLILLEAMSKGMAVATFDCPTGPADIIDDHRNGLIVPPKDTDALAGAIAELIADAELRRRCATAAVATADEYSLDAIGAEWDDLLRSLEPQLRQRLSASA